MGACLVFDHSTVCVLMVELAICEHLRARRGFFFPKTHKHRCTDSGSSRGNSLLRVRQRDPLAVRGILLFHHTAQTDTKARRMLSSSAEEKIDISGSRFQQANNNK